MSLGVTCFGNRFTAWRNCETGGDMLVSACGSYCACLQKGFGWRWVGHFSSALHRQDQKMLLSPCRNSISGVVVRFQSGRCLIINQWVWCEYGIICQIPALVYIEVTQQHGNSKNKITYIYLNEMEAFYSLHFHHFCIAHWYCPPLTLIYAFTLHCMCGRFGL